MEVQCISCILSAWNPLNAMAFTLVAVKPFQASSGS